MAEAVQAFFGMLCALSFLSVLCGLTVIPWLTRKWDK